MNHHHRLWTLTAVATLTLAAQSAHAQQLINAVESSVISWTNSARNQHGRRDLIDNSKLTRAAQAHALNMAARETMSHTLDGGSMVDRVNRAGYAYAVIAENIAFNHGYESPVRQIFDGWMKSELHYRNIMNNEFTEIGVGFAISPSGRIYACQVFGRPAALVLPNYQIPYSPNTYLYPRWAPLGQTGLMHWYQPQ